MKKIVLSPWLALLTLSLIIGLRVSDPDFIQSIRLRYFDTLILSQPIKEDSQVAIVNIDDESIQKYGQFPFPRDVYSKIITDLYDHGAGLVVFNIFTPDKDRFGKDAVFKDTLQKFPVIIPQVGTNDNLDFGIPFNPGVAEIGESARLFAPSYRTIQPSIYRETIGGIGVINTLPEIDGVVRRMPMLVTANDVLYPSIALETLRVASGDVSFQVKSNESGIEAVRIPQYGKIDTDEFGRIWIDWSREPKQYSLQHIPESFDGKIVIVGLSARGLNNPVGTARGGRFPHDVQGVVLETIISNANIARPDWSTIAEIGFTLLLSIISLLLIRWKYGFIPVIGSIASIHFGASYIFNNYHYLLDATIPILGIFLVYSHSFTVKFVTELNAKLQIKKQFGGYLSPIMVERLQKNPELIKLGGERKELSIVMTDLRGFTTLGESFGEDVEGLTSIMNDYMTAISEPVLKNEGCIIKFIGDASLHVHGAPLDDNQHHYNAVRTGLAMLDAAEEFNKELEAKGKPRVGMGVGVNAGQTLIGNIGSKTRFGYDVLGDSVSTAARLEGQTKPYGVKIIISESVAKEVSDYYLTLELDIVAVKGKSIGTRIYTVLPITDANGGLDYLLAEKQHNIMLDLYRSQRWIEASIMCHKLIGEFDGSMDAYYEMLIHRIGEYQQDNKFPKDWDGTYISKTK